MTPTISRKRSLSLSVPSSPNVLPFSLSSASLAVREATPAPILIPGISTILKSGADLSKPPYSYPEGYEVVKHYIINYKFETWSDESKQKILSLLVHPGLATEQRFDNVSRLWNDEDIRYTDSIHGNLKEVIRNTIMHHLAEEIYAFYDEAEKLCATLRANRASTNIYGTRATISLLRRLVVVRDLIREPLIWYDQVLGWNYFEKPDESLGEMPWVGITPGWEFLGTGNGDYFYDSIAIEGRRKWAEITYDLAQHFYNDRQTRLNLELGAGAFPAPCDVLEWEGGHWDW